MICAFSVLLILPNQKKGTSSSKGLVFHLLALPEGRGAERSKVGMISWALGQETLQPEARVGDP